MMQTSNGSKSEIPVERMSNMPRLAVLTIMAFLVCCAVVVGAPRKSKEMTIVSDESLFGADTAKALSTRVAMVLQMPRGSMSAGWAVPDPQPSIDTVKRKYGKADKVVAQEKGDNLPEDSSVYWYGRLGLAVAKDDSKGKVFWVLVE
jgi:hypothetical protein